MVFRSRDKKSRISIDASQEIRVWAGKKSKRMLRRIDWIEHAYKKHIAPEKAQEAWENFVGCPHSVKETVSILKQVLEGVSWTGFYGSHALSVKTCGSNDDVFCSSEEVSKIYSKAAQLMSGDSRLVVSDAIIKAMKLLQIPSEGVSPEDRRLLEIGLEQWQNGTLGQFKPRIGGAPGGPFRSFSSDGGVFRRGAP
jgi:hypothetical protein